MNRGHRKTVVALYENPASGTIAIVHRPRPAEEANRYRVRDARDDPSSLGITP